MSNHLLQYIHLREQFRLSVGVIDNSNTKIILPALERINPLVRSFLLGEQRSASRSEEKVLYLQRVFHKLSVVRQIFFNLQ
jgi:hypothetical protein